jgi:uncharacterized repeat protein (TIGR01451 family)
VSAAVRARRLLGALGLIACLGLLGAAPVRAYTAAAWPDATAWTVYSFANGTPIIDPSDESPANTDLWDGAAGDKPSCFIAVTKTHVFFRIRLKNNPGLSSPQFSNPATGGFDEANWMALVGVNGTTRGSIGLCGKNGQGNDFVYVLKSGGAEVRVFPLATGPTGDGARVVADGSDGCFADWQCPLDVVYSTLQINQDTPLQFFYGTSISNSRDVINKDYMYGSAVVYTGLLVVNMQIGFLEISKTRVQTSGPNPPMVGSVSTYTVTIQVSNTGGNQLNNVQVLDPFPHGAVVLNKSSPTGDFTGSSGQDMVWNPGSIAVSTTVTATVSVSVTPLATQEGEMISLNESCTASGSDPVTSETTNSSWPGPALQVGPVQPAPAGQSVSGFAYLDSNHNSLLDATESGTGLTLYAKRVPAAGGPAEEAVAITPSSGAFTFTAVADGIYSVVLDDNSTLSDISPTVPAAYVGTEAPAFTRSFTMNGVELSGVNLGLFLGAKVSGHVFSDTGTGGGTANNGVQDGGETGLSGVTVYARTDTGTMLDRDVTDALGDYTLFVPDSSTSVKVVETNLANHLSTGGSSGNTGGSYDRDTDTVSYTFASGQSRTGVDFGDVPQNTLVPDGMQTGLPGAVVFYRHLYDAGTAGQVTFTITHTAVPSLAGWTSALYRDADCNGVLDGGETLVSGALGVTAGERLCLLVSEFIPANATVNAQDQLVLTAAFSYTGASPALSGSTSRTDVTMVGTASAAGLLLTKTADLASARPGQTIVYTIAYTNRSREDLTNVTIQDFTPAYTSYASGGCGTTPSGITGCAVTTQPSVGAKGALKWTLTGVLKPGLSGTVTYSVTVD